jgi:hypothetical protein
MLHGLPKKRFKHEALNLESNSVRLIRLLDVGANDAKDGYRISVQLWHQELDGRHIALSYVCGPATPTHDILINGKSFTVRQNLYEFLLQMGRQRHRGRAVFWIDAICINQDDDREKSHQVRRMNRMYERAKAVIYWLGSGSIDFATINQVYDTKTKKASSKPNVNRRVEANKQLKLDAVLRVLAMENWSRTWIFPEILLGGMKGRLVLGRSSMPLEYFRHLLEQLVKYGAADIERSRAWKMLKYDQTAITSPADTINTTAMPQPCAIAHIVLPMLEDLSETACSDVRDRIFVPLTLIGHAAVDSIDYSLSVEQLYAKILDQWTGGMYECGHEPSLEDLRKAEALLQRSLDIRPNRLSFQMDAINALQTSWVLSLRLEAVAQWQPASSGTGHHRLDFGNSNGTSFVHLEPCGTCSHDGFTSWRTAQLAIFETNLTSTRDGHRIHQYLVFCEGSKEAHATIIGSLPRPDNRSTSVRKLRFCKLTALSSLQRADPINDFIACTLSSVFEDVYTGRCTGKRFEVTISPTTALLLLQNLHSVSVAKQIDSICLHDSVRDCSVQRISATAASAASLWSIEDRPDG